MLDVLFVQGFGKRDLFTDVPEASLMGWQRHVGLLLRLLSTRGLSWREQFCRSLDDVAEAARCYVLRDWRYPQAEVVRLRQRFPNSRLWSMVFQVPEAIRQAQVDGELAWLEGRAFSARAIAPTDAERGLFLSDQLVVRSSLCGRWFVELGLDPKKLVVLTHAPPWRETSGNFDLMVTAVRSTTRRRDPTFMVWGDPPLRKGLLRAYRAFQRLSSDARLLVRADCAELLGPSRVSKLPAPVHEPLQCMLTDRRVRFVPRYTDLEEMQQTVADVDVAITPSAVDHGPNTTVECLAMGLPVIASNLSGAAVDLDPGRPVPRAVRHFALDGEEGHGTPFDDDLAAALADPVAAALEPRAELLRASLAQSLEGWRRLLDDLERC